MTTGQAIFQTRDFLTIAGWLIVIGVNIWGWRNARQVAQDNFSRQREKEALEQLLKNIVAIRDKARVYYGKDTKEHYDLMELIDETTLYGNHHGFFSGDDNCGTDWILFRQSITLHFAEGADRIHRRDSKLMCHIDVHYKALYLALLRTHDARIRKVGKKNALHRWFHGE